MGGGSLIRTMARAAVGAASSPPPPPTAAATGSSSSTLCKDLRLRPTILSASSGPSSINVSAASKHTDLEDWELTDFNESFQFEPRNRLIFGSSALHEKHNDPTPYSFGNIFSGAPTCEEATTATAVLENALLMGLSPSKTCQDTVFPSSSASQVQSYVDNLSSTDTVTKQQALSEWVEPHIVLEPRHIASSAVYAALELFKNDATVKEAVKSIVSDQCVWDAIIKNEKVQELMQDCEGAKKADNQQLRQDPCFNHDTMAFDLVSAILGCTKLAVTYLKEKLAAFVKITTLFGDKSFMPKEYEGFNDRLKSCFMLSVIVLSLVLVMRANT